MEKSRKKTWLWVTGIFVVLVLAGVAGWFAIKKDLAKPDSRVERKLGDIFKEMITEASDSLYQVSFSKFDINLTTRRGLITDLKLKADSSVLKRLLKANRAPNNVLDVHIKSVLISNLQITKTEQGNKLAVQNIVIQQPTLRVSNKLQHNRLVADEEKQSKLFSFMKTLLKLSEVQNLRISNMDFSYINNNRLKVKQTDLKNLTIDMSGITAMETGNEGGKTTTIRILKNRLATPDSLYYLTIKDFRFMPQKGNATIKLAELRPRLSKEAYFSSLKWAKDRIIIVYRDLAMRHIDLKQLLQKQQIHIGLMESSAAYTEVYTDYNWPRRTPALRRSPFPHQQLKGLAFDITIDTMKMRNADTHWRVLAAHSDHVSSLDFLKSRGTILNITNNQDQIHKNRYTTVVMNGLFNNAAPMQLK